MIQVSRDIQTGMMGRLNIRKMALVTLSSLYLKSEVIGVQHF